MPRQFCRAPKHFATEHHECYAHDGPSALETSPYLRDFHLLFECQSVSLVSSVVVKLLLNCSSEFSNWVCGWKPRTCSLQAPITIRPRGGRISPCQRCSKMRNPFLSYRITWSSQKCRNQSTAHCNAKGRSARVHVR